MYMHAVREGLKRWGLLWSDPQVRLPLPQTVDVVPQWQLGTEG